MKHILAALLLVLPTAAAAQQYPVVPAQSVIGRNSTVAGPSQAIPFSVLLKSLFPVQAANEVYAGPASGSSALPGFRALVGADLPVPSATTLGGVESLTCSSSNWFHTLSTGGVFGCSQPSFSDLSGTIAASQLPSGVDSNTLNTQTANYTIATTDCGKTIQAGTGSTGFFTLTLPAVTGFAANCRVTVVNGDTGRGKGLSGFPATMTSPNILWPGQTVELRIVNGAWAATNPGRWKTGAVTFFVDTSGSDSNDGLASGTGAFLTLAQCQRAAYSLLDTEGSSVTCSPTSGETFQEFLQIFYPLPNGAVLIFSGNGGAFTWKPVNSSYALQWGDGALVGLTNVTFSSAGVTTPGGFITGHNHGVLDINTGVSVTPTVSTPTFLNCDYNSHINVNNGLTVNAGTLSTAVFDTCPASVWNINGTQTLSGSLTFGRYGLFEAGSQTTFQGNVTFSGAPSGSAALISENAVVYNFSGATLPGGSPVIDTGGLLCTAVGTCSNIAGLLPVSGISGLGNGVPAALVDATNANGGFPTYTAGTWTPTLVGASSGAATYTTQVGSYEQIGRNVTARFTLVTASVSSITGNALIGGLPATVANTANDTGSCYISRVTGFTADTSYSYIGGNPIINTTTVGLYENGSGVTATQFGAGRLAAATTLVGVCNYHS